MQPNKLQCFGHPACGNNITSKSTQRVAFSSLEDHEEAKLPLQKNPQSFYIDDEDVSLSA